MKEQQDAGIIEEVPKYNIPTAGKIYYMPRQLVVREDRVTTKLRIVYDASSELHGKPLNESLENITTKQTDLFLVLLQFKAYKVALIAGIEKAFFFFFFYNRSKRYRSRCFEISVGGGSNREFPTDQGKRIHEGVIWSY